jgi:signal transduction histidine kinase
LQEETFTLSLKDEGFGIHVEEQELIFDRFYQFKKYKISGGFGIGLSYVKELIKNIGGS